MMRWEYRVFEEEDGGYAIREVFYDSDGRIVTCTVTPVEPFGETLAALAQDIEWFKEALTKPILRLADMPAPAKGPPEPHPQDGVKTTSIEELRRQLEHSP